MGDGVIVPFDGRLSTLYFCFRFVCWNCFTTCIDLYFKSRTREYDSSLDRSCTAVEHLAEASNFSWLGVDLIGRFQHSSLALQSWTPPSSHLPILILIVFHPMPSAIVY